MNRIILVSILLVLALAVPWPQPLHAVSQTSDTSVLYVSPLKSSGPVLSRFSINVSLNLTPIEAINYYEVYVKYDSTVLNATSTGQGNIAQPSQATLLANCINGAGVDCTIKDTLGIVHSAAVYSSTIMGPVNAALFSIQFSVVHNGTSLIEIISQQVLNPGQAPNPNAHPILILVQDGVFSNHGVVSFFNYSPAILLVGQPVYFDASGSFNPDPNPVGTLVTSYSWAFGDGGTNTTKTPLISHNYTSVGRYSVKLVVTAGSTASLNRTLLVVPALGGLRVLVKNSSGGNVGVTVSVLLYNGTSLTSLVKNVTRTASDPGSTLFSNLEPGTYKLAFTGSGIIGYSKDEVVSPGWTTMDTVYLAYPPVTKPPMTPDNSDIGFILSLGAVGGGVSLGVIAIARRRMATKRLRNRPARSRYSIRSRTSLVVSARLPLRMEG